MREAGKGSRQRPTDYEKYSEGYDKIFGNKKKNEAEKFDEQVILKNEYYDLED